MPGDRKENEGAVTRLLSDFAAGDPGAHEQLFSILYDQIHALAAKHLRREKPNQTLSPTDLVNEAYLRLVPQKASHITDRTHFFRIASRVIRRVLVDHARARNAQKRGGGAKRDSTTLVDGRTFHSGFHQLDILALNEALEELTKKSAPRAQVVELRFFAGLSVQETATVLGVHEITVKRYWKFTQAWLCAKLSETGGTQ